MAIDYTSKDKKALATMEENATKRLGMLDPVARASAERVVADIAAERLRRGEAPVAAMNARAAELVQSLKTNPGAFDVKTCPTCKRTKPLTAEFFGHTAGGSIWQTECRPCMADRSRVRRVVKSVEEREKDAARRLRNNRPNWNDQEKTALEIRLWNRTNGICQCCLKPIPQKEITRSTIDHIVPLIVKVNHDESNLALVHTRCNSDKAGNSLETHWRWRVTSGRDTVLIMRASLAEAILRAGGA